MRELGAHTGAFLDLFLLPFAVTLSLFVVVCVRMVVLNGVAAVVGIVVGGEGGSCGDGVVVVDQRWRWIG